MHKKKYFQISRSSSYLCTVLLLVAMERCVRKTMEKLLVKVKAMLHEELGGRRVYRVRLLTQHPHIERLDFTVGLEGTGGGR